MGLCEALVVEQPISLDEVFAKATPEGHGAQTVFIGRVRNHNFGKKVVAVSYDCFEPLAIKTIQAIAQEAQSDWGESIAISVVHRTGRLAVGEISVVILVSAPHRSEAYRASRDVIEKLKVRAPIWKKEHYVDGDSQWLQGHALCAHDRGEGQEKGREKGEIAHG